VDGAIHRAAGSELLDECRTLNGCDTGEAKITGAYKLAAKHVIHTVGPVWSGGNRNEKDLLANCYINCLSLAKQYELKTIAFPNISTGVYHFPKQLAAETAITAVKEFQAESDAPSKVIFVCFDDENYRTYKKLLDK